MRIKSITCDALARPVYWCAAQSRHVVDTVLLHRGLHNQPFNLRQELQELIDQTTMHECDAIVLVYGLCGQATAGLVARHVPVVIPRAHDCITLFLGSRQRYNHEFVNNPGTYWYTQDYIERDGGSDNALTLGSATETQLQATYGEYFRKYGKDNADYLMQVLGGWQKHYQRAVYIDMGISDGSSAKKRAQSEADRRGWLFEIISGNMLMIQKLLNGDWPENEFLILKPGLSTQMSYDEDIIKATSGDHSGWLCNINI
jgi:hypothetical protein